MKHIGVPFSTLQSYAIAVGFGVALAVLGYFVIRRIDPKPEIEDGFHFASTERVFAVLMVITACAMAFAHGSNDVANAIGPLAAIVAVVQSGGEVAQKSALPIWVLVIGAMGIVAGLAMYGHRVMETVGSGITQLTPSHGFAATLAAATTVVLASGTGLPISTTHTLVGAVLGVGLARGIGAINLQVVAKIFASWVITLPAGAILAIVFFYVLKAIFQ